MGTVKDTNSIDLTEAEDIKGRWQEELYNKDLHDPNNHDGVIITWSQISWNAKWALGSINTNKASGGDGRFQLSYFKS